MNIILLHGDDTQKSYERLSKFIDEARRRKWKIVRISNNEQSIKDLVSSPELFEGKQFFILDGLKNLSKKNLLWLKKDSQKIEANFIIYEKSILSPTLIKNLPKRIKVEEFKIPKVIFKFLESVKPGNSKEALKLLRELSKNRNLEFIFAMLSRHLRDLYWVKKSPSNIPYPSWRVLKLEKQASNFTTEKLKNLISKLAEIDIENKTSKSNLKDMLDFTLLAILE